MGLWPDKLSGWMQTPAFWARYLRAAPDTALFGDASLAIWVARPRGHVLVQAGKTRPDATVASHRNAP